MTLKQITFKVTDEVYAALVEHGNPNLEARQIVINALGIKQPERKRTGIYQRVSAGDRVIVTGIPGIDGESCTVQKVARSIITVIADDGRMFHVKYKNIAQQAERK